MDWMFVFAVVSLVAAAAVTAPRFTRGPSRAGSLALAAGTIYGLTGALTLSVIRLLPGQCPGHILGHWQLWALAALGSLGLVLSTMARHRLLLTRQLEDWPCPPRVR